MIWEISTKKTPPDFYEDPEPVAEQSFIVISVRVKEAEPEP